MKKKALIIGFGSIGKKHFNVIKKILSIDNIYILSRRKLRFKNSFTDKSNIKIINPDYILICLETSLHFEYLKYVVSKLDNKIILIEKPLFLKSLNLNIRSNKVFVGYNLRLSPLISFIKNYIKNKKIYSFNVNTQSYLPKWRKNIKYSSSYSADKKKGGGILLDLSHEIDIFLWFFNKIIPKYFLNKKISNLNIKSDDYLILIAKFKKNSYINLTQSYFSRKSVRNIFISGENFSLEADLNNDSLVDILDIVILVNTILGD